MPFLKNKQVSLRALEPEDLAYIYDLENKESARQYGNGLMPHSKYVLKSFIKNADKDIFETCQLRLVIEHNETCKTIGMIDLFDFSPHHLRAGVGIWIDEDYRKKGCASEALDSLSSFAFDILLLNQLFCYITLSNNDSLHLFKNAGFVEVGILKQWVQTKDGFQDVAIFQKIKEKSL